MRKEILSFIDNTLLEIGDGIVDFKPCTFADFSYMYAPLGMILYLLRNVPFLSVGYILFYVPMMARFIMTGPATPDLSIFQVAFPAACASLIFVFACINVFTAKIFLFEE